MQKYRGGTFTTDWLSLRGGGYDELGTEHAELDPAAAAAVTMKIPRLTGRRVTLLPSFLSWKNPRRRRDKLDKMRRRLIAIG